MLKIVGFFFKMTIFSILVLVLGNSLHWGGRTISDQVRTTMAHAEHSDLFGIVRNWAEKITHDARQGYQNKVNHSLSQEEIPASEKQKLKALIRELNGSKSD